MAAAMSTATFAQSLLDPLDVFEELPTPLSTTLPAFYIGPNFLNGQGSLSPLSGIPQMSGKGAELGFTLLDNEIQLSAPMGIALGLQITRNRYQFNKNAFWGNDANDDPVILYSAQDIEKGIMRYWSLKTPVLFEIKSIADQNIFISAGAELEYRFGGVSKIKDANGKKHTETKDLGLNPLGINVVAQIGYGDFSIIAHYALTPLTKVGYAVNKYVDVYPFSIGIGLGF